MYHELILALSGFPGEVFVFEDDSFKIKMNNIPFFHENERNLVNELLEVAYLYKKIEHFVEENQKLSLLIDESNTLSGMYMNSVCNGIKVILNKYIDTIADLELEVLKDSFLTLCYFRTRINPYNNLFQSLYLLIKKLNNLDKSSALVLEIVKSEYDMNIQLQEELSPIVSWVNKAIYTHVTNWITFGNFADPKCEFFIEKRETNLPRSESFNSSKSSTISSLEPSAHCYFEINYTKVPSHFSHQLVERILFIGDSISILLKCQKTKNSVIDKQNYFYEQMKNLPINSFRTEELNETIEKLATIIGKDLHNLVVTETNLNSHLDIVKDFYLTGRGELFHDFLLNLRQASFTKNSFMSDIRSSLAISASRVQIQEEILQRIKLECPQLLDSDLKRKDIIENCITKLSLNMNHEWPLQILFTKQSNENYNEIFRFLLQVRYIQLELNTIWVNIRKVFRFPIPGGPAELRNIMAFFIDHLQHYLQENVLENNYSILLRKVEKSENFDQIRIAHAEFQNNILSQSFLKNKRVFNFIQQLLKVCSKFFLFMNAHISECEKNNAPMNEGITKEIEDFGKEFRNNMDLLLNLLIFLAQNRDSGQYLSQFLLRVDYNSFFSSMIKTDSLN